MSDIGQAQLTIILEAGRLKKNLLNKVSELASKYNFTLYFTTSQNLRLLDINEDDLESIKSELAAAGAVFKGPGKFPVPRICVGKPYCKLALVDTEELSERIKEKFGSRTGVKPKFKIAIAACPASCSSSILTDIGVVATRSGLDIYAGGKGGPFPKSARRIARRVDADRMLEIIEQLVDYHDKKTSQKQRMCKLLDEQDFPFREAV